YLDKSRSRSHLPAGARGADARRPVDRSPAAACRAAPGSPRRVPYPCTTEGVPRMNSTSSTIERSQTHATFVLERTYPVAVQAVWHALSDNAARDQWFGGGPQFDISDNSHEFRIGGHGVEDGQWHGGPGSRFVSTYTGIVEPQGIVLHY